MFKRYGKDTEWDETSTDQNLTALPKVLWLDFADSIPQSFAGVSCMCSTLGCCMWPTVPRCHLVALKWLAAKETKKDTTNCACKAKTSADMFLGLTHDPVFSSEVLLAFGYCTVELRHLLLSTGIWGAVDETVQTRLHRAYLAFKGWCATHKIACSQPAFQQKMVAWICLCFLVCQEITKLDECISWVQNVDSHANDPVSLWHCSCTQLYQRNGDMMLICKAYNGRVVMQWLAEAISDVVAQDIPVADDRLAPTALCMFLVKKHILTCTDWKLTTMGYYIVQLWGLTLCQKKTSTSPPMMHTNCILDWCY